MTSRKICVVTGSRAEYGLLRWLMEGIRKSAYLELQVLVTGMHLSPEFGLTWREIENDGFEITRKVEMLLSSDTSVGVTKAIGVGIIGFADALNDLQPDLLLVLGDRFEIYAAATAAMIACIPIAHLHGGETSEGAFDEAIRHSITKMSHLHFVAAPAYQHRVIQLGEAPERVFLAGGLGIDNISKLSLLDKPQLEEALGFKFGCKNLLVTFHPVSLEHLSSGKQITELLKALDAHPDIHLIFTMPNADTDGRVIMKMIEDFVMKRANSKAYISLGQLRYFSCLQFVDGVIGNSSSGLIEVPSFRKGTINIGDRQRGRLKAPSVIDCEPDSLSITAAIETLYSSSFQASLQTVTNPYGGPGACEKIIKILENYPLDAILKKSFHDIDFGAGYNHA